jgi:hypothetical protein
MGSRRVGAVGAVAAGRSVSAARCRCRSGSSKACLAMTRVLHGWQPLEGPAPGPAPGLRLCRRLRWTLVCSVAIFTPPTTPRASCHRRIFRPHAVSSHYRRGPQPRLRGVPVRPCLKMPTEGALRCSPRHSHHSIQDPICSFSTHRRQHEVPRWCVPLSSTHPVQGQS